jgi:hypothetical protein
MFNPTRDQVREFFIQCWRHYKANQALTPLESLALEEIFKHPEYHSDLERPDALTADYPLTQGRTNPFLHLSMHLAIAEQLSIDHPPGIQAAYQRLAAQSDPHHAIHTLMECLGQVIWEAQRLGKPLDNATYLHLIQHASQLAPQRHY